MKSHEINDLQATPEPQIKQKSIKPYFISYGLMILIPIIKEINQLIKNQVR